MTKEGTFVNAVSQAGLREPDVGRSRPHAGHLSVARSGIVEALDEGLESVNRPAAASDANSNEDRTGEKSLCAFC